MPPPVLQKSALSPLVTRVAGFETRIAVKVIPGPEVTVMADADQLEQMLINLVRNAAEAVLEGPRQRPRDDVSARHNGFEPTVSIGWKVLDKAVALVIEDNGPGLLNPSNAFVPFYTTKPSGSGIGLDPFASNRGGAWRFSRTHQSA